LKPIWTRLRCRELQLDQGLPDAYDEDLFYRKCDVIYRHVFDAYQSGPAAGVYATV